MDELKKHTWINAGYNVLLTDVGANMLANYTDAELKSKGVNVKTVLMAQKIAKKLADNRRDSIPQKLVRKRTLTFVAENSETLLSKIKSAKPGSTSPISMD